MLSEIWRQLAARLAARLAENSRLMGVAKEPKGLPIIVGRSWSLQPLLDEPMASKRMVIEYATQVPPNNCRKALVYRRELRLRLRLRLPRRCPRWCSSGMKRRARMRRRSRLLTGLAVPAS